MRHVGSFISFPHEPQKFSSGTGSGRIKVLSLNPVATEQPPPVGDASVQLISSDTSDERHVSAKGRSAVKTSTSSTTGVGNAR